MLNIILTCRDILCVDINVDKRCVDHSTSHASYNGMAAQTVLVKKVVKEVGHQIWPLVHHETFIHKVVDLQIKINKYTARFSLHQVHGSQCTKEYYTKYS